MNNNPLAIILGVALVAALVSLLIIRIKLRKVTAAVETSEQDAAHARADAKTAIAKAEASLEQQRAELLSEQERVKAHYAAEVKSTYEHARESLAKAQTFLEQQRTELLSEQKRVKSHYEIELEKAKIETGAILDNALKELAALSQYKDIKSSEAEVRDALKNAISTAATLRAEAEALLDAAKSESREERAEATKRAKEINAHADAVLDQATRDAGRLVAEAHKNAEQIAGDAYTALRERNDLERAVKAIRNVIDGYGDRYIVPTRSLLDDLAQDFGHTDAGKALTSAREQSKRMVEELHAAECEYAEANRRETAIRFVIDAFNGRVDAILSRTKHDNFGTLEQEIRDAFSLVNLNGGAFRNARILQAYLDARLAELKWAVVAQELRQKEREEQRRLKEQIREEEKARREYERAIKEAEQEEAVLKKALEKARSEVASSNAEQRAKFEEQVALLNQKLAEAEAKNQRALSMAQQTKKGNVYIISNVGSFGNEIFKIGMTRRLEPMDRVAELSDASVPFDFDVHAMIPCEDAPALEAALHHAFDDLRINQVNFRKEFFRVPLERVRSLITEKGIDASFTMLADAHEWRETQVINKMTPDERERYYQRREMELAADTTI